MGTFHSFRKALGALKDSTTVGLAKVNSEYKELDIAIVRATSHVEYPPKERHVRKILYAAAANQPRADVAYSIHALSKRLSKTRSWIVAIKTLIVLHRILREGDPTFIEDLAKYSHKGHIFQMSNFKDDSSPEAWVCSAWVRSYALFLEERLECFKTLGYDIETERLTKSSPALTKAHSKTRTLGGDELLEQLPALQQLLHRLIGCEPEGSCNSNYLIQYALALFFEMPRHEAVKALYVYKRARKQAEHLADFYEYCKGLDLARNFQFPILRQVLPPITFIATMEEYIKEAPQTGYGHKRLEYQEKDQAPRKEPEPEEPQADETQAGEVLIEEEPLEKEEAQPKEEEVEPPPLISTDANYDLLGLNEINPKSLELEERNALALAILPPGGNNSSNLGLSNISGTSGWELALVTAPSNLTSQAPVRKLVSFSTLSYHTNQNPKLKQAGGFDNLLLDSLYEDENARRQLQLRNAGHGYEGMTTYNPLNHYNQHDPFAMYNNIAPPPNVQMALMAQQQQQMQQQQQQMMFQQQQQYNMMMFPYQNSQTQYPQQNQVIGYSNPFGDPLPVPNHAYNSMPYQGNYNLL
ncbi:unnamed protein product [Lupinus luteus]|uniref:ENTH domain-containing protein n=1 Tax=Lupinus luteus TaxID=3873 RepID=A0AAV1YAI9_LUPLU